MRALLVVFRFRRQLANPGIDQRRIQRIQRSSCWVRAIASAHSSMLYDLVCNGMQSTNQFRGNEQSFLSSRVLFQWTSETPIKETQKEVLRVVLWRLIRPCSRARFDRSWRLSSSTVFFSCIMHDDQTFQRSKGYVLLPQGATVLTVLFG